MTLSRLRSALIHGSNFLPPAAFTIYLLVDLTLPARFPWQAWLAMAIVFPVLVLCVAAFLMKAHKPAQCERCDDLRARFVSPVIAINDPVERAEAFRRRHVAWQSGLIVGAIGVILLFINAFVMFAPLQIAGLVVIAAGLWILGLFHFLHIVYDSPYCDWCQQNYVAATQEAGPGHE